MIAIVGLVLVVVALVELSTEVGRALGFIGLLLLAIAGLSQLAARGSAGPPGDGGPGFGGPGGHH